jgi:MarR family
MPAHDISASDNPNDRDLCYLDYLCNICDMPTDSQITYADHVGRFYARRYGFPPMVGRLIGYLAVCDPQAQTIAELSEALLASRSAITQAVKQLETLHLIRRTRTAGERMDRVQIDMSSPQAQGLDSSEFVELGELAREGLEVVRDAPPERRAVLLEFEAYSDFLIERIELLKAEWGERRAQLVADGTLPERSRS